MESGKLTPEIRHLITTESIPQLRVHNGEIVAGKHVSYLGKIKGKEIYRMQDNILFTVEVS